MNKKGSLEGFVAFLLFVLLLFGLVVSCQSKIETNERLPVCRNHGFDDYDVDKDSCKNYVGFDNKTAERQYEYYPYELLGDKQ